jgi:ParB family chromosome partitioning protein
MSNLQTETLKIASLTPDPTNARKHDKRNLDAIKASLKLFGQRKPIVVTGANLIVAGNGTVEAAKELGWSEIDVVRIPKDWDAEQVKAYALADNRTAELAEWDTQVLTDQLLELDASGWQIFDLGFVPMDAGLFDVAETAPPSLEDGDKRPFQQITFTLHNEQADLIYEAMKKVKLEQDITYHENDNSNANAIYAICKNFLNG